MGEFGRRKDGARNYVTEDFICGCVAMRVFIYPIYFLVVGLVLISSNGTIRERIANGEDIPVFFDAKSLETKANFEDAMNHWNRFIVLKWHFSDSKKNALIIADEYSYPKESQAQYSKWKGNAYWLAMAVGNSGPIIISKYENNRFDPERNVLFHEIGHILGLEHNENPNSIMYYESHQGENELDDKDMDSLSQYQTLRHVDHSTVKFELMHK